MRGVWRVARAFAWMAVVGLIGASIAGPAVAGGKANRPAVLSVEALVDGSSATVLYTINRTAQQVKSQSCTLNGAAIVCDPAVTSTQKKPASSSYSVLLDPLSNGNYTFAITYRLGDGGSASASIDFTINVAPTNQAPIAVDDSYTTSANEAVSGNVLANDSDPNGDPLSVALATGPSNGTLTLNANGEFTYTPNADFYGTNSFTYAAFDGHGGESNFATVVIHVTATAAVLCNEYGAGAGGFFEGTDGDWGCYGVPEVDLSHFNSVCLPPNSLVWELAEIGDGLVPSLRCVSQPA